jgi:hypothetical protein
MAKLILKFSNEVIDHIDLRQGDMKIGRRPGTDIQIDNLAVSGEHANLFTIGDDTFVQDLGSTNGTFVNNKQITKHHLRNGDTISIGKHTLVYVSEDDHPSDVTEDFSKTVIISPTSMPSAAPPKPAAPASGTGRGVIIILNGANSGKQIQLTKSVTSLGKTGKKAGSIVQTESGFMLTPSEGSNENPVLNGRPVPSDGTLLKNGDVIEVSGTRIQFALK